MVNIIGMDLTLREGGQRLDKGKLIVHCAGGVRSAKAGAEQRTSSRSITPRAASKPGRKPATKRRNSHAWQLAV